MPTEVIMPKVDMDMAAGTIVVWHATEGDRVVKSAPLFDIETDKATMEVESPASGVLHHVTAPEGTSVPIGQAVAWVYADGETVGDAPNGQSLSEQPAPANDSLPVEGASVAVALADVPVERTDGVRATPLARRTAREHGLALSDLNGSGPRGRITKVDVEAAVAGGAPGAAPAAQPAAAAAAPAPAAAPAAAGPSAAGLADAFGQAYTEVKNSNMRKTVARRLTEAKQTVPHFYLTVDCELDALLATRKELNGRAPDGVKLSVNDMIIKAVALALRKVPEANASWTDEAILLYSDVDVSVAVAIEGGLITPIIKNADQKGLSTISAEMKDLAGRAREGKLKPEEYQGGGFSVSNLGMFGVKHFEAIINPPQGCILAVGAGEQRAVVKDGALAIATVMSCTLSVDHRVVDGAIGAQFLQALKGHIQDPLSMML